MAANFRSAIVNGRKTHYYLTTNITGNRYIYIHQTIMDFTMGAHEATGSPADTSLRKSDEELVGIARAAVEKLTGGEVISATIQGMATYESEDEILIFETTLLVHIFPEEGGFYAADVRVSDGMVYMIVYKPDPAEFPNEYHW